MSSPPSPWITLRIISFKIYASVTWFSFVRPAGHFYHPVQLFILLWALILLPFWAFHQSSNHTSPLPGKYHFTTFSVCFQLCTKFLHNVFGSVLLYHVCTNTPIFTFVIAIVCIDFISSIVGMTLCSWHLRKNQQFNGAHQVWQRLHLTFWSLKSR